MTANVPAFYEGKSLDLVRRTVAKDCNPAEFDQFIHICRHTRLDPLKRQIYCFVFNKHDNAKRQMVIVTGISGYRAIAERTGNYRPDEDAPRITYDDKAKNKDTNPLGIVKAEVCVYKFSHGAWYKVTGEAYWDEYVPISGGRIDSRKGGWVKSPRVMLPKCAEAQALRKAWPDDFANLYLEDEMDRSEIIDITPTEAADQASEAVKLALVGGANALTVQWGNADQLVRVSVGEFVDRVVEYVSKPERTVEEIHGWWQRNLSARAEFKAKHGHDFLELQRVVERIAAKKAELEAKQKETEDAKGRSQNERSTNEGKEPDQKGSKQQKA